MRFADVCVNAPLGRRTAAVEADDESPYDPLQQVFTYAVPEGLRSRLRPGHLVWVPFRSRRLQAVVLSLSDVEPEFATKAVRGLVWSEPVLTEAQLGLARWISDYYLAPLIEAFRLMLPVGLTQRGRTVYVRTAIPVPDTLTERQLALLDRIAKAEGTWPEVSAGLRGVTQRADLEPLIAMNLVSREVALPRPPPRPKTERRVSLLVSPDSPDWSLPTLGRPSKQGEVLAWLLRESKGEPARVPVEVLRHAVQCNPSQLRTLAERGVVQLIPGEKAGISSANVQLNLALEEVEPRLIQMRGLAKHHSVLDVLLSAKAPVSTTRLYRETGADQQVLRDLEGAGVISIVSETVWRDPLAGEEFATDTAPELTADQVVVWEAIQPELTRGTMSGGTSATLLYGVTGSGKTEIYLRAIAEVVRGDRQAVVLVPEISLTPQTIRRFAARFPGQVTVWHSELGDGERFDIWRRVRAHDPAARVVVGSRSALLLPYAQLGLIVLDEEHESSYKQDRTPRYHARTTACELGRLCSVPVLLGSATPALETYHAARSGSYGLVTLPWRITPHQAPVSAEESVRQPADPRGLRPGTRIVDMRQELRAGNRGMFSRVLEEAIRQVLADGQQAILFLNRRGAATFVMCRDCGYVEVCSRCATPLTFHSAAESLLCHHCNRRYPVPSVCRSCGGRRIRYFGAGTETLEDVVRSTFPAARLLRWDRDVTGAKGSHDAILKRFIAHEADILIGTQMIAKGLDLPLVTLVGIVAADTGLYLPDFRASERTFQLLTQVAGRAGRTSLGGRVIIQTYHPEHYAIVAASHHDYESFYRQEIGFRRAQRYPPLNRLAKCVYYHTSSEKAQAETQRVSALLRAEIERRALSDTTLIGPAPCFFSRQRGFARWQVVVCGPDPSALLRPLSLPAGWRLDIDPVDLL